MCSPTRPVVRCRRTRWLGLLLVAVVLGAAGCQASEDEAPPSGTGSAAPADPTTGETGLGGPHAEASSTETLSPTTPPADGPLIEGQAITYRLPGGVEWSTPALVYGGDHTDERTGQAWRVRLIELPPIDGEAGPSLDESAQLALTDFDEYVDRGANVVIDDVEWWAARGVHEEFDEHLALFGTVHNGHEVRLTIGSPDGDPRTEEWIEAILASVEWLPASGGSP